MVGTRDPAHFVSYREIRRRTGKSNSWLLRQVMLGKVIAQIEPGEAPKYSLEDVEREARKAAPRTNLD